MAVGKLTLSLGGIFISFVTAAWWIDFVLAGNLEILARLSVWSKEDMAALQELFGTIYLT